MTPKTSQLTLKVRLPGLKAKAVAFEDNQGTCWKHRPVGDIGDLKTVRCWKAFLDGTTERRKYIQETGAVLGEWLFDDRAVDHLVKKKRAWTATPVEENQGLPVHHVRPCPPALL